MRMPMMLLGLVACVTEAGPPGEPGPPGDAGGSCSVASTPTGATISCDDGTSADIANGEAGEPGEAGQAGEPGAAGEDPRFGTDTSNATAGAASCVLGSVWLAAGSVAGGLPAEGQLLSVNAYPALFSLLGTQYGGDGRIEFALPDLRDAAPNGLTYVICADGEYPRRL